MADGKLMGVKPAMDVHPFLLRDRPLKNLLLGIGEKFAQGDAEPAVATVGKLDRPIPLSPGGLLEPRLEPFNGVTTDRVEAREVEHLRRRRDGES